MKKVGLEKPLSIVEIGNPVDSLERRRLFKPSINCIGKITRQFIRASYGECDLLIGMKRANLCNMACICDGDLVGRLLLDFIERPGDIADQWHTQHILMPPDGMCWRDVGKYCKR